jgi:hypothetical protein
VAQQVIAPSQQQQRRRNPTLAASLSIVPGLGQLYNLQVRKAIVFLLLWVFTLGPSVLLIMAGEDFGHHLLVDKQFGVFLLVAFASIIAFLILFLLALTFWAAAVVDARRSAKRNWLKLKL